LIEDSSSNLLDELEKQKLDNLAEINDYKMSSLATNYANLAQNYDKIQSKTIEVKETLRD